MSSRPKSILPYDFEETAGFRETTLYVFPPEHSDTVRRFGRMLYEIILEGMPYFGEEGESTTLREMQAALADAVHLRDFFWGVGQVLPLMRIRRNLDHLVAKAAGETWLAGTARRPLNRRFPSGEGLPTTARGGREDGSLTAPSKPPFHPPRFARDDAVCRPHGPDFDGFR